MDQVVRRVDESLDDSGKGLLNVNTHRGEGLLVEVVSRFDANPQVQIRWRRLSGYANTLLRGFMSRRGFCPEDRPEDAAKHGDMIFESIDDDVIRLPLAEGAYYFTLQFQQKSFFGMLEAQSKPVRFRVEVPSLDVILKRVSDLQRFEELQHQHKLRGITRGTDLNRAVAELVQSEAMVSALRQDPKTSAQLHQERLDATRQSVEAALAMLKTRKELREALQGNADFKALKEEERGDLLRMLDDLDPSEERM